MLRQIQCHGWAAQKMAETVSRLGCSKNGRDTHTDRRISPLYISEIGQLKIWHHSLFIPPSGALVSHLYITVNSVCLSVCLCLPFFEQTSHDTVSAIFLAAQPWHCICHFLSRRAVPLFCHFLSKTDLQQVYWCSPFLAYWLTQWDTHAGYTTMY